MGILRELLHDFTFGLVSRDSDEREAPYRCVKCGTGFDQNYQSCPKCGNQFIAAVGGEDDGDDESRQQGTETPWDR